MRGLHQGHRVWAQGKNRKVYMLAELEPSREITGGVWYTDNELDTDLIEVLRKQCLHYIMQEVRRNTHSLTPHIHHFRTNSHVSIMENVMLYPNY